ncbi:MAG: phosphotransferase family protein [Anaerolineae bacterium]
MIDYDNRATAEDLLLAKSIAQQFIGAVDGGPVQIPVGSVNKVFQVEANGKSHIIRLTQDQHRLGEYQKEAWCAQQARAAGVRTPEVTRIGNLKNTAFMIQEFVAGTSGTDGSHDRLAIWQSQGEQLAKIHAVPINGFGLELVDPAANQFSDKFTHSFADHIDYNISTIDANGFLRPLGVVSPAEHAQMLACFHEIRQKKWQLGLCHGDLSLNNVIVTPLCETFIIDWGCARSHVIPYFDFTVILKLVQPTQEQFETFLQAYGFTQNEFEQVKIDTAQMLLLSATDTLRWAIGHNVVAIGRYISSVKWALDVYQGRIDLFDQPYHEEYGLENLSL